ncbi:MAG: nitrogen regulation protein NR(I) [Alphaproteobacteria bacterium]|nr:MAG: nitrogen regulation protein NR(I) [Alphaproteobacteria bacterium]
MNRARDKAASVIIADDDRSIRRVLAEALSTAGFETVEAADAATLWDLVTRGIGDVAVTDVLMPDANGLDLLPRIASVRPELPVIVISAQNTLVTAVRATERGAFDYLAKPFDLEALETSVRRALDRIDGAAGDLAAGRGAPDVTLIGRAPAMQKLYRAMARLMSSDVTVLIEGESGTGKELVARALHGMGRRRKGPFVAVNMAAIPRELVESTLFGHERGAFTGATARATGRFEQAHRGTLFLDEIGDMPLEAQTRLLRVLQEGEFTTVGGTRPIRVDVRVIAASNKRLADEVAAGRFREDLYYRLNVVPLHVPPLRERLEDIPDLAAHFLARGSEQGLPAKRLTAAALAALKAHHWPGNVRELENLVQRLMVLTVEERIGAESVRQALAAGHSGTDAGDRREKGLRGMVEAHLARYFAAHGDALPPPGLYGRILREVERPLIALTLRATRGNQIRAAAILGINRNTLRKKIRELGIDIVRPSR